MQRQISAIDSHMETVDIDQGSVSEIPGMSQQTSLNNLLNPIESGFPNNIVSYAEESSVNTIPHNVPSFSGWNVGESSSRLCLQNRASDDGVKLEEIWSSRVSAHAVVDPRSEETQFESTRIHSPGRSNIGNSGDQVRSVPLFLQGSGLNNIIPNPRAGSQYVSDCSNGAGTVIEIERASSHGISSDDVGMPSGSSGHVTEESHGGSGSSVGGWGLSCKRKALEGSPSSGHSFLGESSSCSPQSENGTRDNVSRSLSLSTASRSSTVNSPEQPSLSSLGVREVASETFSSSSVIGNTSQFRNFSRRLNRGHPFARNVSLDLRAGNPSSSLLARERDAALQEEANSRDIPISITEHPMPVVPPMEIRNLAQDQMGWSLAMGNLSASGQVPSTGFGSGSSVHHLHASSRISHHNPPIHNQQRYSEYASWSPFPSVDSELLGDGGHFPPLSSGALASVHETGMSSRSYSQGLSQSFSRSNLLIEGQGDDVLGMPRSLRALASDIEGRHRLISEIRQVLNAMRRGENLRVEDYMLFDPFVRHGMAEMHDRHRDMRLDIDNMSYEELLALEKRIGDVSTGLSEETILKLMKQQKFVSNGSESGGDTKPCCICQGEFADGDDLGMLDCEHGFHTNCIKQWLMQKNLCPICKRTAIPL